MPAGDGGMKYTDMLSEGDFAALVARERSRADRNGHGFSLVVIDLSDHGTSRACAVVRRVADTRMRAYDAIGWLAPGRLGILLPDATARQAALFAETLCGVCECRKVPAAFSIVTHPAHQGDGGADAVSLQAQPLRVRHDARPHARAAGAMLPRCRDAVRERAMRLWARLFE
jgi:hypothetical protein